MARSNEVKALGVTMGTPWFQMKDLARKHGIIALSSNYALYADMSNRMMSVLARYSPDQEIYSIDECFLGFEGFGNYDLEAHAQAMRWQVRQWVGIPVCVGIAETRTLAKLANHCAKKSLSGVEGVCDLTRLAIETLVAILGVSHPGMLEYEAFDSAGSSLEFGQLGLKITDRKPPKEADAPDANELLLKTISDVTGFSDLELDGDGDIGVRYGSMIAYARVIGTPPAVHFFSPLVREVEESPALFERINELNRGSREVRYFVIEGTIFAAADVRIEPFVESIVANTYRHFCQSADDVDELLQSEFGGKTMYEPCMSSTVRH